MLADHVVEPTIVNHTEFEQSETLAVSDDGQLIGPVALEQDEQHLNGHSFGLGEGQPGASAEEDRGEPPTEDLESEEAGEEFIADNLFIKGDQQEEELPTVELPGEPIEPENTPAEGDQQDEDLSSPEDDGSDEDDRK